MHKYNVVAKGCSLASRVPLIRRGQEGRQLQSILITELTKSNLISSMGRYRSRSKSNSPPRRSPPPPPPRRRHNDDPRSSRGGDRRRHSSPAPSGLLVRNISLGARPEDIRIPFERFGPVKDVYLPRDYHTGEPRGFGFVKFRDPEDAVEAKHHLDHTVIFGREISIVYAEENRKTPQEMRFTSRVSGRYGGSTGRHIPPRSPRRRYRSYSRSPSPRLYSREHEGRDRNMRSVSRSISRSPSPRDVKYSRRSRSPMDADRSPHEKRSRKSHRRSPIPGDDQRSPSPLNERRSMSPKGNGSTHDATYRRCDQKSPSARNDGPGRTESSKFLS